MSVPNEPPMFIILDMSWIKEHENSGFWMYERFPVREIIAVFASASETQQWEDVLWEEFRKRFDDTDIYDRVIGEADMAFEKLVEEFYASFYKATGDFKNHYLFYQWLDPYSLVLICDAPKDQTNK